MMEPRGFIRLSVMGWHMRVQINGRSKLQCNAVISLRVTSRLINNFQGCLVQGRMESAGPQQAQRS